MTTIVTGQTLQESGTPRPTSTSRTGASSPSSMKCATVRSSKSPPSDERGCSAWACSSAMPPSAGRMLQQVSNGDLPTMTVARFAEESGTVGPFRTILGRYAQANLLQIMQCTACNALHNVEQRCCRWLLQTQDRVGADDFLLKHEFLAIMLGVQRPTVTLVLGSLQRSGLISTKYGRIRVLDRKGLERASCECHEVIQAHFDRLGL